MLLRKTPLSKVTYPPAASSLPFLVLTLPLQRLTSDEVEAKLTDVLLVLKYVQNKDVFMRYHKAHLTRFPRLLNS